MRTRPSGRSSLPLIGGRRPTEASKAAGCYVRCTSTQAARVAQIAAIGDEVRAFDPHDPVACVPGPRHRQGRGRSSSSRRRALKYDQAVGHRLRIGGLSRGCDGSFVGAKRSLANSSLGNGNLRQETLGATRRQRFSQSDRRRALPAQAAEISDYFRPWQITSICAESLVELRGFEPLTSAVRLQRSPI